MRRTIVNLENSFCRVKMKVVALYATEMHSIARTLGKWQESNGHFCAVLKYVKPKRVYTDYRVIRY